jgi:hypothetical protein
VSGLSTAQQVPAGIRTWIMLHATAMYERRESVTDQLQPLPFLGRLLDPYRTFR